MGVPFHFPDSKEVFSLHALGAQLEGVLDSYRESLGGTTSGVPRELLAAATPVMADQSTLHLPGPADAVAECSSEDEPQAPQQAAPSGSTEKATAQRLDHSCAIVDSGMQDMTPLRLWNMAMQKYEVLQGLQEQHEQVGLRTLYSLPFSLSRHNIP